MLGKLFCLNMWWCENRVVTELWGFVSRDQQSSNVITMATRQGALDGLLAGWLMTLSYPGWSREIPLLLTLKSEETWFGKRWKYDKCLCTHLCVRVWARARERNAHACEDVCVYTNLSMCPTNLSFTCHFYIPFSIISSFIKFSWCFQLEDKVQFSLGRWTSIAGLWLRARRHRPDG